MLKKLHIQNYRSFVDTTAEFSPFTIVTGANGSGKTNLLRLIEDLGIAKKVMVTQRGAVDALKHLCLEKHVNRIALEQAIEIHFVNAEEVVLKEGIPDQESPSIELLQGNVSLFNLDPGTIGAQEFVQAGVNIESSGTGAIAVLDSLKTGDREDLFNRIEERLIDYIPSIEKLSLKHGKTNGKKLIQVREKGVKAPLPISELSEGTRLLLLILTIVHQEDRPSIICLEDIDRGLHPRLFQNLVKHLRNLCQEEAIQIIASTHNPYLIDEFIGDEDSVLLVEKKDGESTITSLAERIEAGDVTEEGALGSLWFGGFAEKN